MQHPNRVFDSADEYYDYLVQLGQQLPPDAECTVESECDPAEFDEPPFEEEFEVTELYPFAPEDWVLS